MPTKVGALSEFSSEKLPPGVPPNPIQYATLGRNDVKKKKKVTIFHQTVSMYITLPIDL